MLNEYPDVLNINQVSAILGVCTKTVYKLLREHRIKHIKIGKKIRVPKINLISYLQINE
jgi:excisionase family DNA binding protein